MKTEHMNTLQLLFLEFNRERTALIAMDADGARQRLLTSRVEAIDAAMRLAEGYLAETRTLWGIVANAGRLSTQRKARWAHVVDATGLGSTKAAELCRRFERDPDEVIGGASTALVEQIDAMLEEVADAPTPIEKDIATVNARVRADYTLTVQEDQAAIDAFERIVAALAKPQAVPAGILERVAYMRRDFSLSTFQRSRYWAEECRMIVEAMLAIAPQPQASAGSDAGDLEKAIVAARQATKHYFEPTTDVLRRAISSALALRDLLAALDAQAPQPQASAIAHVVSIQPGMGRAMLDFGGDIPSHADLGRVVAVVSTAPQPQPQPQPPGIIAIHSVTVDSSGREVARAATYAAPQPQATPDVMNDCETCLHGDKPMDAAPCNACLNACLLPGGKPFSRWEHATQPQAEQAPRCDFPRCIDGYGECEAVCDSCAQPKADA